MNVNQMAIICHYLLILLVNCTSTSFGARLGFFGKRKMIIWKLAACCSMPLILICKIGACIGSEMLSSCGASSFLFFEHVQKVIVCACVGASL